MRKNSIKYYLFKIVLILIPVAISVGVSHLIVKNLRFVNHSESILRIIELLLIIIGFIVSYNYIRGITKFDN